MVDVRRAWDKFSLLFWKNWLLQSRHRLQTVIEILVPVIFCALLVVIRSLVVAEIIDHNTKYDPFPPERIPDINVTFPCNDCDNTTIPEITTPAPVVTTTTQSSTDNDAYPTEKVDMIEGANGWEELMRGTINETIICQVLFNMSNQFSKPASEKTSESKNIYKMAQERFDRVKGRYNKEMAEKYGAFGNQLDILYKLFPEMFASYKTGFITLKRLVLK